MENRTDSSQKWLTIVGMFLTLIIAIGSSYVTTIVTTNVQAEKVNRLTLDVAEALRMSAEFHEIAEKARNTESKQSLVFANQRVLDARMDSLAVKSAQSTEAINNLVKATESLTKTTQQLVIQVTRLQAPKGQ